MANTVANQKTVKIQKELCDTQHLYAPINLDALQSAMIDLKGESFKMWIYLSKNRSGYEFALSRVDAIKWGIGSSSSYDRAIAELRAKGYLVEVSPNHFEFYEKPKAQTIYITKVD